MRGGNGMTDGRRGDGHGDGPGDRQGGRQGVGLEDALRVALRPAVPPPGPAKQESDRPAPDQDGAARAVAAFRAARDEGLHASALHASARTRRRDDWRPAAERRIGRSLKTAVASLLASVTLGGVAIAAGALPTPFREAPAPEPKPRRSASVPQPRPPHEPAGPPVPATPPLDRETLPAPRSAKPATARDHEALCSAYEKVKGHGRAAESTAWQRLVTAAGGEQEVPRYCGEQPASGNGGHQGSGTDEDPGGGHRSPGPSPHPVGKPDPDRP